MRGRTRTKAPLSRLLEATAANYTPPVPALDGERATVLGGVQGKLASLVALRATLDSACAP